MDNLHNNFTPCCNNAIGDPYNIEIPNGTEFKRKTPSKSFMVIGFIAILGFIAYESFIK